jgi:hypothetical protein
MAAEPEHAAHASSGLLRVVILRINRSPQGYHDLLGPLLPSAPLRELQQACKHAGVEAPNGCNGPKLFAAPDVARRALAKLAREGVQLGTRHCFSHELKAWHIIVQEDFVDEVEDVLRQLPGREHVHVRGRVTIELDELDIEDDDEEDFLDVSHLVRSLEEMRFRCTNVSR